MKPLFVLLGTFLLAVVWLKFTRKTIDFTFAGRVAMAVMLVFTACGHFFFAEGMSRMVPEFIPMKVPIIWATGIAECLFAIALFAPAYRWIVGWALLAFLVLILPANIKAALDHLNYQTGEYDGPGLSYLWFRIPLQLVFMAWVYWSVIRP